MMRKLMVIALLGLAVLAFVALGAVAQEAAKEVKQEVKEEAKGAAFEYVGADKCKLGPCHPTVHESWLATKHAKAFDLLSAEDKAKPECAGACHITGKLADGTVLAGAQCEACHGPGSQYKSPKIMSKAKWAGDPETYKKTAVGAGLVYPTAETCAKCHKEEGNPNFKPLDYEKSKGTVHPVAAK